MEHYSQHISQLDVLVECYIKNSRRTNLKLKTLDNLLRVNLNGPKDIKNFVKLSSALAQSWRGLHSNDLTPGGGRPRKRPSADESGSGKAKQIFSNAAAELKLNEQEKRQFKFGQEKV